MLSDYCAYHQYVFMIITAPKLWRHCRWLLQNEEDSIDDDAQSSQHTDVAVSEDVVGSRPLLEDDGLEEDEVIMTII